MAYQIVLKISYPPYRVQGEQSASMQLRLLGIPSLQSGQAPAALKLNVAMRIPQPWRSVGLPRQLLASYAPS
jgi:hypothetical protein